ncbi:MAG: PIG-L deacetylase family protein [Chitinispirillia bacterium]|jgi:LmbE family N-acetylglucosaminyl deacetylase
MVLQPNNDKFSKIILAIGSHPDDIEFGCGGTLYRMVSEGFEVFYLVMTEGDAGGDKELRKKEQIRAAEYLGVKKIFWGGYEDTQLPSFRTVIQKIEEVVQEIDPSFVLVHYDNDTHQDHRQISACTLSATRKIPNVLFYEGPTTIDFKPSVYVNIQPYLKQKFSLLTIHESQVSRTYVKQQSILEIARAVAIFRGNLSRVPYAEAFLPLRFFL